MEEQILYLLSGKAIAALFELASIICRTARAVSEKMAGQMGRLSNMALVSNMA